MTSSKNAGDIKLATFLKIARNPVVDQIDDCAVFIYRVERSNVIIFVISH